MSSRKGAAGLAAPLRIPLIVCVCLGVFGCRSTQLVVVADYDTLWQRSREVVRTAGYDMIDREADGLDATGGTMDLSHRIRLLHGEHLTLRLQADRPAVTMAREVRIGVREENTLVFIFSLGFVGNSRLEHREQHLARALRAAMGEPVDEDVEGTKDQTATAPEDGIPGDR